MAYSIDWGILSRMPNIGDAITQGYQAGRQQAQVRARDDALKAYAANPTQDALAPLAAVDPQAYALFSKDMRERDALGREAQARAMIPDVLAGAGFGGRPTSMSAPAAAAPDGELTVTAPTQHASIADLYALDPEVASALIPRIGELQDQHREKLSFEADALGVAAFAARQVKYDKRREVIDRFRPQLLAAGFSNGEIDDFDPTDEGLTSAITHSLGVKEALANARSERSEERQEYYRARTDARAESGERRAQRGEQRSEVRFRERNLDRAAIAASGGGIRSDTSDLDY